MLVISNAGPLISLARVKQFHLLRQIYDHLTLPQAVYEEVVIKGASRHGAAEVQSGIGGWIELDTVKTVAIVQSLLTKLGQGESETIALALDAKADLVLLDDGKARTVAEFMGLNVIGTVGVLLQAHQKGLLGNLKQVLDDLRSQGFRISDEVYTQALETK